MPGNQVLTATTIALLVLLVLTPPTALVSDRVGRRPMFLAAAIGYALFADPVLLRMTAGTFATVNDGGLVFAAINSLFAGCMAATMVELFPTRNRYTGIAIGYNVGQALLGGTAPLVATSLIELTGNNLAWTWYLIGCDTIAGLASLFIPTRHDRPLDETSRRGVVPRRGTRYRLG